MAKHVLKSGAEKAALDDAMTMRISKVTNKKRRQPALKNPLNIFQSRNDL